MSCSARAHLLHTFFGMGDGGALAFFQFAEPAGLRSSSVRRCRRRRSTTSRSTVDKETQQAIEARIADGRVSSRPQTYVLEHGYCRSVYVTDPNGLILEFTLDHPDVEQDQPRTGARMRTRI